MRNLILMLALGATLGAAAQKADLQPVPQQAAWGDEAFPNTTAFTLVGEQEADADALALLRANVNTTGGLRLVIGESGDKAVKKYRKLIPDHPEGYYLSISPEEVVIAGRDGSGTFYGVETFLRAVKEPRVCALTVTDWPSVSCRGVIEGFYGNPWSHADRLRQFDFYGRQKMNIYVYGPKDDPYHRAHWREAYPEAEAARIRELVERAHRNKVQFVWAVHPGGDIRWNLQDSMAVCQKLERMYELGVRTFAVFFDDIWGEGAKGDKQAGLLNYVTDQFVRRHADVAPLIMCPTQYNKAWSGGDYLTTLGKTMYPEVRIMWTGNSVVDMIEHDDMAWINQQIGRKAFIWLNYPVNDYCQSRLLMGKTYGNGLDIADMVSGFCSNPMEYAEASKVSLFSIADYTWNMPAYRAEPSWEKAIDELMPTARQAFRYFCQNNVDLGVTGHGLRREGESPQFSGTADDFVYMSQMARQLLADSVNHPEMLREIAPWVRSMDLLGQRGTNAIMLERALENADSIGFIGLYRAAAAMEQAQKAITSRDYEGSIVKAKPMPSGDVVTPWVRDHVAAALKQYRRRYTYGLDQLPQQVLADGEYYIKVDGKYLTDQEAQADRVGDAPVLVAARDSINPQRQQWVIELDAKTERYKITNKQDGRYLNELAAFWRSKNNPYSPDWNTFILTRDADGRYAIQNAGSGGKKYWRATDSGLAADAEKAQYVFEILPL